MNARLIAKIAAKAIVATASAGLITKGVTKTLPPTQKLKISEIVGSIGAGLIMDRLDGRIDAAIDAFFDKRDARKLF